MRKLVPLVPVLVALVALAVACGDGDGPGGGGGASPVPVEGGLPPGFPEDFPLYPGLNIRQSSPLGDRYIIEADSADPYEDVAAFYEQRLAEGRWELLEPQNTPEPDTRTFRFTAPGFALDGRIVVAKDTSGTFTTIVGIAMPIEAGDGGE